ncbi:unnamed protein product [Spirodela intermedia]|uniref:U-box domain-containing protein n=1 Tax=Spirodela intermedia TaxID=51605 RepID=A0A7I8JBT0_SPIIN|nr:unnamed protein product [Spirodela intermedia]CAA6667637.1 unnamed protein product [Spirodela intermedia]
MGRRSRGREDLEVNVPSFFRCPISLDVMKSPVSLCTGVTYDRSSIQTWIETGHNTCPATMQVLPTTDLVPNHTLHRLIQLWSFPSSASPSVLLRRLQSSPSGDPLPILRTLLDLSTDPHGLRELVDDPAAAAVCALSPVLLARHGDGAESLADSLTVSSLLAVLKGESLESRIAAAEILEAAAATSAAAERKLLIAGTGDLLAELLRLVREEEEAAADAGLSCLVALSPPRQTRVEMVRAGAVAVASKLLKALKLMEVASTCSEGRAAICEDPVAVPAIVGKMMKVSAAAREHAVVVLWSVCYLFRDRRAQEAATRGNGLMKILLLMQSNCSPATRQMAADLIKIFRVSAKGRLTSYDSMATHITPF